MNLHPSTLVNPGTPVSEIDAQTPSAHVRSLIAREAVLLDHIRAAATSGSVTTTLALARQLQGVHETRVHAEHREAVRRESALIRAPRSA